MSTLLIVVLVLLLIGALPVYPHSRDWGAKPAGLVGTILIIVLILWLLGGV